MAEQIGDYVLIIEDVREGNLATGEIGVYEGDEAVEGTMFGSPRIRLADNTVIYGFECWWRRIVDGEELPDLKMEQTALEEHKAFLREIFIALEETNG